VPHHQGVAPLTPALSPCGGEGEGCLPLVLQEAQLGRQTADGPVPVRCQKRIGPTSWAGCRWASSRSCCSCRCPASVAVFAAGCGCRRRRLLGVGRGRLCSLALELLAGLQLLCCARPQLLLWPAARLCGAAPPLVRRASWPAPEPALAVDLVQVLLLLVLGRLQILLLALELVLVDAHWRGLDARRDRDRDRDRDGPLATGATAGGLAAGGCSSGRLGSGATCGKPALLRRATVTVSSLAAGAGRH